MGTLTAEQALEKYDESTVYDDTILELNKDLVNLKNQVKAKRHQILELEHAARLERKLAKARKTEVVQLEMGEGE